MLYVYAKSNFLLVTPTLTSEEVKSGLDVSTNWRGGRIALKYIQIHHNFAGKDMSGDFVMQVNLKSNTKINMNKNIALKYIQIHQNFATKDMSGDFFMQININMNIKK